MRPQVDIFVPIRQQPGSRTPPSPQQDFPKITPAPDTRARLVGNDMLGGPKKPPLDHLRPRYLVQRPQPSPVATRVVGKPTLKPARLTPLQSPPRIAAPVRPIKKHRWRRLLLLALAAPSILTAGVMLQTVVAGEVLIGLYAVIALLRRIESRTTFMLALVSLSCILVMLLVRPDPALMRDFAIYSFLLMLVGTLSLTAETRY